MKKLESKPKDEKFTPKIYLRAIREVLGVIDLDPFSCEAANKRVKAVKYFSKEDNAFKQEWNGKIYANPPYSRGFLLAAVEYLISEDVAGRVKEAIFLGPNSTEQAWFQLLLNEISLACLTNHRISFINGITLYQETNPENGSAFFYLGDNQRKFCEVFNKFGTIITAL